MYLNPIVKKDVKVQARSMKICWSVFAYELILALVFFLAINVIQSASRYSTSNIYSAMVWLYPVLAVTQLIILGLVVPIRTASSISGEKEQKKNAENRRKICWKRYTCQGRFMGAIRGN